jgi:hypothetical protein
MSKARRLTMVGLAILLVTGIYYGIQRRNALTNRPTGVHQISTAEMIANARRATENRMDAPESRAKANWARKRNKAPAPTPEVQPPPDTEDTVADPIAHEALIYVGLDPRATEYWIEAINDPEVSEDERHELIVNLREAGVSNVQNPTPEDLELITTRIRLIEAIGGDALDETNADAFRIAYGSLVQFANLASQQLASETPDDPDGEDPANTTAVQEQ